MKLIAVLLLMSSSVWGMNLIDNCIFGSSRFFYDERVNTAGYFAEKLVYGIPTHVLRTEPPSDNMNLGDSSLRWRTSDTDVSDIWIVFEQDPSTGFENRVFQQCKNETKPTLFYLKIENVNLSNPRCVTVLRRIRNQKRPLLAFICDEDSSNGNVPVYRIDNSAFKRGYVLSYRTGRENIGDYHYFLPSNGRGEAPVFANDRNFGFFNNF